MEKHPFVTSIQIESDKLIIKGLPLHNGKTTLQLKTYFSDHLKSNRRIDLIPEDLDETDNYCRLIPSVGKLPNYIIGFLIMGCLFEDLY